MDLCSWGVCTDLFQMLRRDGQFGFSQVRAAPVGGFTADNVFGLEKQAVDRIVQRCALLRRGTTTHMHVIVEDFILRHSSSDRSLLSPVRITAMLYSMLTDEEDSISVHMQQPSDAMSIVTDARLKELGLWQVGRRHANDAARHMVLFLTRLLQSDVLKI